MIGLRDDESIGPHHSKLVHRTAKTVNNEIALLFEHLEEEIYMECLQGMTSIKKDNCIILNKCIYGLVQVACQYYKRVIEILKSSTFVGGSIDPCLYVKKSMKGIVYVVLYIDDNQMVGDIATIDDTVEALKNKGLVLKIVDGLQDYLSYKIKISDNKKHAWLGQPHLIKNLKKSWQVSQQNLESQNSQYLQVFYHEAYRRNQEDLHQ